MITDKQLHRFILLSCLFSVFWLGYFGLKPALMCPSNTDACNKAYWFTIDIPFERLFSHTYSIENVINGAVVIGICMILERFGQFAFNNLRSTIDIELMERLK